MNINANPDEVINNLLSKIAQLTRENAFYSVALNEAKDKIKELEENAEE